MNTVLTLQQKLSKAEDLLLEAYYILPREGDPIAQKVKEALWAVREQLYTFEGK
jgi:hypothetical protein